LSAAKFSRALNEAADLANKSRGLGDNPVESSTAGLDVFEHEPAVNPRLLASPRVVALPHMSSATIEGRIDMGEKVIINIKTFADGHAPPDRVHPAML